MICIKDIPDLKLDGRKRYKIKVEEHRFNKAEDTMVTVRAKLIQQTKWLFVFEYRNKLGILTRAVISKCDYLNNRRLIEVC